MSKRRHSDINRYLNGGRRGRSNSAKRNRQNHRKQDFSYSQKKSHRSKTKKYDLHNLGIHQARNKVIEECQYAERDVTLEFIHGFNHGTTIRDFIRNGQLEQSLRDRGINFELWNNGSGSTYYNRL